MSIFSQKHLSGEENCGWIPGLVTPGTCHCCSTYCLSRSWSYQTGRDGYIFHCCGYTIRSNRRLKLYIAYSLAVGHSKQLHRLPQWLIRGSKWGDGSQVLAQCRLPMQCIRACVIKTWSWFSFEPHNDGTTPKLIWTRELSCCLRTQPASSDFLLWYGFKKSSMTLSL